MPSRGAQQQIQRRRTEQGDDLWELLNRLLCVHQNGKSLTGKIEGLPCRSNAHSGIGSRNCHHAPRAISAPASQCILPTARGANVAFYRLPSLACNPKNGRCGDLQTLHGWRHSPLWRCGNVLNAENREPGVALSRLGWRLRRLEEATVVHRDTAAAYLPLGGIAIWWPGSRGNKSLSRTVRYRLSLQGAASSARLSHSRRPS